MNVGDWFRKNGSVVLTCLGAIGMVGAVALAAMDTPKAIRAREEAQAKKGEEPLTRLECVRAVAPAYIPTAAAGTWALICIFGAHVLSRRQQTSLASAYAALESAYQGYRRKVCQITGDGTDRMIVRAMDQEKQDIAEDRPPWDEAQTFYFDANSHPRFFERTMEQVLQAEYHINRNLVLRGYVTLNEFLSFLNLDPVEGGELIGWDQYYGETDFGYRWIDFNHRYYTTDDEMSVCSIETPFEPHPYQ